MAHLSGISIIICCHNSKERLEPTLKHIAEQEIPSALSWEVVLVDNNSNDGTAEYAQKFWGKLACQVPFRIVYEPRPGLSSARVSGIGAAKYGCLVFCDDDNWLSPKYAAIAWEVMEGDAGIGALGGHGEAVFEAPPPDWFHQLRGYGLGHPMLPHSGYVEDFKDIPYGAGMVLRKSAFEGLLAAGFEFQLSDRRGKFLSGGGDTELFLALLIMGWRVFFDARLSFKHFITSPRLTQAYASKISTQSLSAHATLTAYGHAWKKRSGNPLVYYIWMVKILSTALWGFFSTKKGFAGRLERDKRWLAAKRLLLDGHIYLKTRKYIKAWRKNL